jgi:hypothetical protein
MASNEERAERAVVACDAYADFKNEDPADTSTITDLVVDLMHLAELRGCCVEQLIDTAKMHYDAEVSEDQEEDDWWLTCN